MDYDGGDDDMYLELGQNESGCNVEIINSPEITNQPAEILGVPYVGLEFASMEEAREYYEEYGKQTGFCIRTRSTARNRPRSNEITGVFFVCIHEGKLQRNQSEEERDKVVGEGNADIDQKKKSRTTKGISNISIFQVKTRDSVQGYKQHFVVQWNPSTTKAVCTCKHFEFSGMICKHLLKVIQRLDLERIPESLIHNRWRKGANQFRYMEPSTQLMSGDNEHDEALRFNYLTQHFSQLTFAAAPYYETFNICKDLLDDGSKKVASALKSAMLSRAANLDGTQVASNFHASDVPPNLSSNTLDQMSQFKLLDPNVSKTKGRRKGKKIVDGSSRMKSSLELATQKRKRKCKGCGQLARHDIRNCPVNPRARRKINVESPDAEEDNDHEVSEEDDTEDDE